MAQLSSPKQYIKSHFWIEIQMKIPTNAQMKMKSYVKLNFLKHFYLVELKVLEIDIFLAWWYWWMPASPDPFHPLPPSSLSSALPHSLFPVVANVVVEGVIDTSHCPTLPPNNPTLPLPDSPHNQLPWLPFTLSVTVSFLLYVDVPFHTFFKLLLTSFPTFCSHIWERCRLTSLFWSG